MGIHVANDSVEKKLVDTPLSSNSLKVPFLKNIIAAGPASIEGLGDALQYLVMAKTISDQIPDAYTTVACPNAQIWPVITENSYSPDCLLDNAVNSKLIIKKILRFKKNCSHIEGNERVLAVRKPLKQSIASRLYSKILKGHSNFYFFNWYFTMPFLNSIYSDGAPYDAGIFGGHTICCNLDEYSVHYRALRSVIPKGPLVTAPISVSFLALNDPKNKVAVERLKKSLKLIDHIYVRGPRSLKIFDEVLNINTKIDIALDHGFGLKKYYPNMKTKKEKCRLRVIIIPRKDFFEVYKKMNMYKLYLTSISGLIRWLIKKHNAELFLALQIRDKEIGLQQSGLNDLITFFKKNCPDDGALKIFHPVTILDAVKFYSTADIVISSYMHGGIMAMSTGVPTIFMAPMTDTKILDNLENLKLDPKIFLIDLFDPKSLTSDSFIGQLNEVLMKLESYKVSINNAINRALPTIDLPVRKAITLANQVTNSEKK